MAEIGSALDDWDFEDTASPACDPLPGSAEEAWALVDALRPIVAITINRRAANNLRLLERVDELIGTRHEPGWDQLVRQAAPTVNGDLARGQEVALRAVEDPEGPFRGEPMSVLTRERWLISVGHLEDGTLLPLDGTRRLAVRALSSE